LDYTATLKQIYYLEEGSNKVKIASHARFDEGMNDVSLSDLPPFARHIHRALGHNVEMGEAEIGAPNVPDIFCSTELFPVTFCHAFHILPSDIMNENGTLLGFNVTAENDHLRPYISNIVPRSTATQFLKWYSRLIGAFILSINGNPVQSKNEVDAALSAAALVQSSGEQTLLSVFVLLWIDPFIEKLCTQ
jgi:hypothetical protein